MLIKLEEKKVALEKERAAVLAEAEKIQSKIALVQELIEEEKILSVATAVESVPVATANQVEQEVKPVTVKYSS